MRQAELEQLYARLERPMYNVAFRWTWSADEAQDAVQEAFVRLWRMGERVQPATVEPLVYRILTNLIRSRLRKKRVWRWVTLEGLRQAESPGRSAEDRLMRDAEHARVREALEELPEELRRVVVLCECSELTYEQIGSVLSIPAGTVGSRRNRALRLLRQRLEERGVSDERTAAESV